MKNNSQYPLAIILSIAYLLVSEWNGLTRQLGGYYNPYETRHDAVVGSTLLSIILSLILFALIRALRNKSLFAIISWIGIAPALLMLSWSTITKNLVERGLISVAWLTDSAYINEPGVRLHRTAWILAGILVSAPFLITAFKRLFSSRNRPASIK